MKDLLEISCGLDIHKEKIVACILTGPLGKPTHSEIREFTTLIPDMLALRDWIISENCHHIAMESTGIYWIPIYEILEDAFSGDITLLVVNARHMKNVPGKKTDIRDSEWISTLLRAGLLNASFIPEKRIREFRDLNRYRKSIIRDITSQKNRVEKFLQSSGFRLSSFISDIFGASGRNIILHLMEHGQIDKMSLDSYLKTKTRKRIDEILMSVNGTLSELLKEPVCVIGASRTDSGVHALGNVAVFDTESRIPAERFSYALNQRLPKDIVVVKSDEVDLNWHPRYQDTLKTYEYHIINTKVPIPTERLYNYFVSFDLDVGQMRRGAAYLEGEHDFAPFCCIRTNAKTTVRTITDLQILQSGEHITIRITGNGFLYNMVRIIAGVLVRVGRGFYGPEKVKELLEGGERTREAVTAPPQGLCLMEIRYQNEE